MKLYEGIHANFERFCRARVYGEMSHEDLINEALLIAYQKFDTRKSEKELLSFLIGTSVKLLSNSARKNKAETGVIDLHENRVYAHEKTETQLEVRMLYEAISKLPEDQKNAIIMFEITGYSIRDIATLEKIGESAIKQRLRRGRIHLKELLTETNLKEQNHG